MASVVTSRDRRQQRERRIIAMTILSCVALTAGVFASVLGPAYIAFQDYKPHEGDVVFQSLPRNLLVNTIEGVTESSFSHCGIVAQRDGEWVVYEAFDGVEATPLSDFIFRGRGDGFAVYRLKLEHQKAVPAMLASTRNMLGRPYDARDRMDDERIYCSELVYKAYREATGKSLGKLVQFGDLRWQPFEAAIVQIEGGPVPVTRRMITPKDLALATQLKLVTSYGIDVPKDPRDDD